MTLHITANTAVCIGAGQCVMAAPDLFDQEEHGTVIVLEDEVPADELALVREAAYLCPSRAITYTETSAT
ncbi:ferredoxin [Streptomyces sp. NPDC048337]|uniref:ferredoxin n=1 Tax=Streptomyces sp. NPDC048337 TaxID=3365535 RepID=UPI00371279B1